MPVRAAAAARTGIEHPTCPPLAPHDPALFVLSICLLRACCQCRRWHSALRERERTRDLEATHCCTFSFRRHASSNSRQHRHAVV
eukprot:3623326-Rhodomonas_salina.1